MLWVTKCALKYLAKSDTLDMEHLGYERLIICEMRIENKHLQKQRIINDKVKYINDIVNWFSFFIPSAVEIVGL